MNVGSIVTPNTKGQIVIPSHLRKALGITEATIMSLKLMGPGIYLQPMKVIAQTADDNGALLALLAKTRGTFAGDLNFSPARLKKKRAFEHARAKRLKQA